MAIHCHNWMNWLTVQELKKEYPLAKVVSTFHLLQKQYDHMLENPIPSYHDNIISLENEMLLQSDAVIVQSSVQLTLIQKNYNSLKDYKKIKLIPSGTSFKSVSLQTLFRYGFLLVMMPDEVLR